MAGDNACKSSPPATTSKMGLIDARITDEEIPEKHKGAGTIKIKKPAPKLSKPGSWKDNDVAGTTKTEDNPDEGSSPLVNPVDDKIAAAFPTGRPFEDDPEKVQCKHCKRPVLKALAADHVKECLRIKQEKIKKKKEAKEAKAKEKDEKASQAGDVNDADSITAATAGDDKTNSKAKGARKSAVKASTAANDNDGTAKKTKKRKADGDAAAAAPNAKKKKKDEPKVKTAKPKGPVDVERQCGVQLPNGAQCARSLTCKSHSMGAKRAVPGRSMAYNILLAQYQKKNQAKQQRAAIEANAPLHDDPEQSGPIDSEEEKDAIMSAIARSRPRPLVTHPIVDTRQKYRYIRMKEMLHNALGGSRGSGLFSTGPQVDTSHRGMFSAGPASAASGPGAGGGGGGPLGSAGLVPPDSAFGSASFASPLNSAGLDSAGGFEGHHSRRPSAVGGPRQILPGQLPPPTRKPSISGAA